MPQPPEGSLGKRPSEMSEEELAPFRRLSGSSLFRYHHLPWWSRP